MIDSRMRQYIIGIAGVGFVGEAAQCWFEQQGYPLFLYDKHKHIGSLEELNKADIIFLCLPTPFREGRFDDSAVWDVLERIEGEKIIVVKSTVLPGSTEEYQRKFPQHTFFMNPEFLRASTAREDFLNPNRQIVGYTEKGEEGAQDIMSLLPPAPVRRTVRATEAEMIKYFGNLFLASRVVFANHMYDVAKKLGIDYDTVKECAGDDPRIGKSHFDIFHEGYRGYSGSCLPKDTKAFISFAERLGTDHRLFAAVDTVNEELLNGSKAAAKSKETILVTGGAGFIGSHVSERLLKDGHRVVCLDNFSSFYDPRLKEDNIKGIIRHPDFVLVRGDILDTGTLRSVFSQYPIAKIVHLAALPGVRTSFGASSGNYVDVNLRGTLHLLEEAKENGVKQFVFASSSSVYGKESAMPFQETENHLVPISPYGVTKLSAEVLCRSYHTLYGIPITVVRIFSAFGPRQRPELALHLFARCIKRGEEIPLLGSGEASRDITYVGDIVEGISKALVQEFPFEVFNLGNSRTVTVKEMIAQLAEKLHAEPKVKQMRAHVGDLDITFADISKARNMLGWEPQVSFEEGVDKFLEWYKEKEELLNTLQYA